MKLCFPLLFSTLAFGYEDTCAPFHEIYKDGTELCELMWQDSFEVVDDEDRGYTMWFFDAENNPNDAMTRLLKGNDTEADQCGLNSRFHKDTPSPEGDGMGECHPWKNNACCDKTTVGSVEQLNGAYGEGFEWNRCGVMSQSCERFFVQEVCFYECEPNAGLYRKFNSTQTEHPEFNEWQMYKMPIKKSYCNAWYDACYNDYFCGGGNFFECGAGYNTKLKEKNAAEEKKGKNLVIGVSVAGGVAALGLLVAGLLICKEKTGKPFFAPNKSEIS